MVGMVDGGFRSDGASLDRANGVFCRDNGSRPSLSTPFPAVCLVIESCDALRDGGPTKSVGAGSRFDRVAAVEAALTGPLVASAAEAIDDTGWDWR